MNVNEVNEASTKSSVRLEKHYTRIMLKTELSGM